MSGHTKGAARVEGRSNGPAEHYLHIGVGNSPMVIASMNHVHIDTEANAARLVACWNVCEGIPTKALEGGSADIIEHSILLMKERDALRADNARLRDCLERLAYRLDIDARTADGITKTEAANLARAALAKVES